MAATHRVVRVAGGRLVNVQPRADLEAALDEAARDGYSVATSFTVDDNVYLVLRNED